jgi:hypothetical protein
MKKTKQITKRLVGMALALAVLLTMLPVNVQAAAKSQSITLYKGEAIYFTDYGTVSKVSSSNKKVIKAAKDSDNERHANLTAKATGKSTVTVKTSYGTTKLKVTVKKLDFTVKLVNVAGGNVIFSVKNNTAQTFDTVTFTYTLVDEAGDVIVQDTKKLYDCLAKKTAWCSIYVGSSKAELLDAGGCSGKVTAVDHSPNYTYKDVSSKVKATVRDEEETDEQISFKVTTKNTTSQSVSGYNYILYYDAQDQLIDVNTVSLYLTSKATDTSSTRTAYKNLLPDYDHYKIVTQAYYRTSK